MRETDSRALRPHLSRFTFHASFFTFPASIPPRQLVTSAMHKSRLNRGLRATFLGLAANTVLAAVKLLAGIVGHSHALVADAVESLADVFSSLVVWRALVVADAP